MSRPITKIIPALRGEKSSPHGTQSTGVQISLDELIHARLPAQRLRLAPRIANALRGGAHLSRFRGRGIDFEEVRMYQPGDDIRSMDWRVTARTGRPHAKVFREERERPVLFAVDLGPSMQFGTRVAFKSVTAAKVAAFWAWCAARHGDRVGGVLQRGQISTEYKPRAGHSGVLHLLSALAEPVMPSTPAPEEAVTQLLQRVRSVAHPGSLIVWISDFRGLNPAHESALSELRRHSEMVAVQIYDALEEQLPPPGYYAVSDGRRSLAFDAADPALRSAYQQQFVRQTQALHQLLNSLSIRLLRIATHEDPYAVLSRELREIYGR